MLVGRGRVERDCAPDGGERQCGESAGHGGGTAAQGGRTVSEPCRASDTCQTQDLTPDRQLLLSVHNSAIN